jgi:phage baseplate assembly protein W
MSNGITYGISFPFNDSREGKFLELTQLTDDEIRTNLIHLILTKKGSRYFLPNFGTRLYEFIFEPMDGPTFTDIQNDIRDSVDEYLPGVKITNIDIQPASENELDLDTVVSTNDDRIYRVPGIGTKEHTARIKIDYTLENNVFNSGDFVIINI